jgi:deoxyribose-phosphate aldolase
MVFDERELSRDPSSLAKTIDLAILAPGVGLREIQDGCREARNLGCASVCVPPAWVGEAARRLAGSDVAVGAVVGFPSGATTTLAKVFEALECVKAGATELDLVVHVGAARSGDFRALRSEAEEILRRTPEATHKFILEMSLLSGSELERAVKAVAAAGPAFLKTGTGTVGEPVTPGDVERLRRLAPRSVRIKAAGGIRDRAAALALLRAGADRLGSSTPRNILQEGDPVHFIDGAGGMR